MGTKKTLVLKMRKRRLTLWGRTASKNEYTLDILKEGGLERNIEQPTQCLWMDDRAGQGGM